MSSGGSPRKQKKKRDRGVEKKAQKPRRPKEATGMYQDTSSKKIGGGKLYRGGNSCGMIKVEDWSNKTDRGRGEGKKSTHWLGIGANKGGSLRL